MHAFAEDLERYLAGEAVNAKADRRLYLVGKALRKYRLHAVLAAFLLVVLTASWLQIRRERDNARATAQIAHAALETTLGPLIDGLARLPGGLEMRGELLGDVQAQLDALGPFVASDRSMERLRAAWHQQRGDIARAQGRLAEAETEYLALVELARSRVANDPSLVRKRALMVGLWKLARVSRDWDTVFLEGKHLADALLRATPDDDTIKQDLGETRIWYARRLFFDGKHQQAAEQIDLVLALAEPFPAPQSASDWLEMLGEAYEVDGDIRRELGEGERAIDSLQTSVQIRQQLVSAHPADLLYAHGLMLSTMKLGSMKRDGGQADEAQALLERAVEIGVELLRSEPAHYPTRRDLYSAYDRLARFYAYSTTHRDLERAETISAIALTLVRELPEIEGDRAPWRGTLGMALKLRGSILFELDLPEEAYVRLAEARDQLIDDLAGDPVDSIVMKYLADVYDRLGKTSRKLNEHAEKLDHYYAAHSLRRRLHDRYPQVTDYALKLIVSQTKIGEWHFHRSTLEDDQVADGWYGKADVELRYLEESGVLRGREPKYQSWRDEIDRYRRQLVDRLIRESTD